VAEFNHGIACERDISLRSIFAEYYFFTLLKGAALPASLINAFYAF